MQSARAADINMVLCYPDGKSERPLSAGSLVSRSFDTGGVTYQTARSNTRQQFINYALELSVQAFPLSWERLSVQFARAGTTTYSALQCVPIHHKAFPSSIRRWRVMDTERLRLPFFLATLRYRRYENSQMFPSCIYSPQICSQLKNSR